MAAVGAPLKAQITFGKFENVDLRVARVMSATAAKGTNAPCRVLELDLGHLGRRISVGQFALVSDEDLIGRHVVACVNLAPRQMGPHMSQALVLGVPHPESPADQAQAIPLHASDQALPGSPIF